MLALVPLMTAGILVLSALLLSICMLVKPEDVTAMHQHQL